MKSIKASLVFASSVVLSAGILSAQSRATVPITLTITPAPLSQSYAIPLDFSGLSFGTTSLRGGKNGYFFDSSNSQVLTLFQNLGVRSLRIGGTSVDTNTGNYIPAERDIDALFRFAQFANVKVIYSVRLENGDPSADAATAQYVWQNYSPLLADFAIGNEPDIYKGADPKIKNFSTYLADWNTFSSTIASALPSAKFGGPDSSDGESGNSWGTRFASAEAASGDVNSIFFHYYFNGSSAGQTVQQLIDGMLEAYADSTAYPTQYNQTGAQVLALGLPYRFTESDSYYTGGDSGVPGGNNCFASALYAVDYMHWWAEHQAAGVNFHTSMWKYNGTFYPDGDGNYQVYPIGYGIKAFDLGGHGYVEPVTMTNPNGSNVTAYAVGDAQNMYVTVINKTHSPYLNAADAAVTIQPAGFTAASAASLELTDGADGDASLVYATLGGATINDNSRWQGTWTPLFPETGGSITVTVPADTATVVKIRAAGNYAGPVQINQNGALEIFGTTHDGDVWHNWQSAADVPASAASNWNGWTNLEGVSSKGGEAVAKNADNTLEVFVPGATGDVYYNHQLSPGGGWSGWTDMGNSSIGVRSLRAANNADGSLSVFGIGANGDIWFASQSVPGGTWSNWADVSGEKILPGFVVGENLNGLLQVFGVDRFCKVWQNEQTSSGAWSGWTSLSTDPTSNESTRGQEPANDHDFYPGRTPWAVECFHPELAIAQSLDGRLELFALGVDSHIYHTAQQTPGGAWTGWRELGGPAIQPGFVAGQNADGRLAVFGIEARAHNSGDSWRSFAQDKNGRVVTVEQESPGGAWGSWTELGRETGSSSLAIGNTADGRIQLFAIGDNGDIQTNWQSIPDGASNNWNGWVEFDGDHLRLHPATE